MNVAGVSVNAASEPGARGNLTSATAMLSERGGEGDHRSRLWHAERAACGTKPKGLDEIPAAALPHPPLATSSEAQQIVVKILKELRPQLMIDWSNQAQAAPGGRNFYRFDADSFMARSSNSTVHRNPDHAAFQLVF